MKQLNRLIVAGAATALLPFAAAFAQTPPSSDQSPPSQTAPTQGQGATFESLDTNSDGKISKDEAAVNATVTAQFSSYDVNGDGFIERAEVTKASTPPAESPQ